METSEFAVAHNCLPHHHQKKKGGQHIFIPKMNQSIHINHPREKSINTGDTTLFNWEQPLNVELTMNSVQVT